MCLFRCILIIKEHWAKAIPLFVLDMEASWSEWSPCSHTCGAGKRKRVMMCNLETDSRPAVECLKALQTQEIKNCYIQDCQGKNNKFKYWALVATQRKIIKTQIECYDRISKFKSEKKDS